MRRRFAKPRPVRLSDGTVIVVRSGLEAEVALHLDGHGVPVRYEKEKLWYEKPAKRSSYLTDFILPSGVIVECKGLFTASDRAKHLLLQMQHPKREVRFVFSRSKTPIRKGSATTYGDWCRKHGFLFADETIPRSWLKEKP